MFQLYKSRNFGAYFSDTFSFLKLHGKHFFKNYLIVNGIFLLILIAVSYMFFYAYQNFLTQTFVVYDYTDGVNQSLVKYSRSTIVVYLLLFILVLAIVGILNYAYVPIYFKLYERHKGPNFAVNEIASELKANVGKLFKFILASFLVGIPLIIVVGIVSAILIITMIGIPLLLLVAALVSLFYHTALMEYMRDDAPSVFECFSYSLNLCFQKFFPVLFATGIFLLIALILQSIVGIIEFIILMAFNATSLENPSTMNDLEPWSFLFIITFTLQIISYLINYLTSLLVQVNQAVVYFSLKEEREHINTQFTIDQIGSDE